MRFLAPALSGLALVVLLWLGFLGAGRVPPVGQVVDPWRGVWAAAASADLPPAALAAIPGLSDTVRVVYDDRAVPHIFARSEADAYRALGYVVARDRLFQLEMQTRATAGTLSEVLGRTVLDVDRMQRSLGLAWSAEREWAALDTTSAAARGARAFADGVNAWIGHLSPRDFPLEYHLLRSRPMPWKPQYTLYLLRRMGYTLAFNTAERQRERLAAMIGDSAVDALFPLHAPIQQPIQPGPWPYPRYDFHRLIPPAPRAAFPLAMGPLPSSGADAAADDAIGSNNWAVSPKRSATGHALLAGDPHLDLTLPSIWYEVQLSVHPLPSSSIPLHPPGGGSGDLDAYGVTIPGVPGVVIGFNRDLAWSFTNTESDVLDLYAETLDHQTHPTAYRLDGAWHPLDTRVERYLGTRGEVLAVDTIYYTHRGPLSLAGRPTSMRWTVLEASSVEALAQVEKAHSVDQWLRAMEAFRVPAQNGVVADRSGTIAIRSNGAFPLRPGDGRGDRMRDGTTSRSDWTGYWPLARYPFSRNPAQGYLVSANQEPKDPRVDPGYLGSNWPPPWRAIRINQLLAADSQVTVDAMRSFQTDPGSARADALVPVLIRIGRAAEGKGAAGAGGAAGAADLKEALDLLAKWDRRYTRANAGAVIFEFTMQELQNRLWDELLGHAPMELRRVATPGDAVLLEALQDSLTPWWDDRRTPAVETREDVVAASFTAAWTRAKEDLGDPATWRWDRVQRANIYHLLQLPSLSALRLPVQGGPSTISPSSGSGRQGPSWRMVVELGPEVKAFGTYPGGQSGNPASSRYLDRLPKWLSGQLDTLRFPRSAEELPAGAVPSRLTLTGTGGR